jgi:hypothetical protein
VIEDAIEKLVLLLQGNLPEEIDVEGITDEHHRKLAALLNQLFTFFREMHEFTVPLSNGNLNDIKPPQPRNFLVSPFKELHSRLLHLTWQAEQVARGDYSQRVDFMGDFSNAFNHMVESLDKTEKALRGKIEELEAAISRISQLEGILPICASCKRVRLDGADPRNQASWVCVESYISDRTAARFSHSICPECMRKFYPEVVDRM